MARIALEFHFGFEETMGMDFGDLEWFAEQAEAIQDARKAAMGKGQEGS